MNCPGCGAAMKPVGNRNHLQCEYCRSIHFHESSDDGYSFTNCISEFACPVCDNQVLSSMVLEGQIGLACVRCRGIMTDMANFNHAVSKRRARKKAANVGQLPFDRSELLRRINCPVCQQRMETYPYAGGGNAVVDACDRCRVIWLDAGELEIISSYVPAPPPRSTFVPSATVTEEEGLFSLLG